jgi:ATP-dependent RNA helicase RhlE
MASLSRRKSSWFITTDIMARGLDISNITHVINFEMPEMPELYMHCMVEQVVQMLNRNCQ